MCPVSVTTALASCPALRTTGKGKNFRPHYRRSDPRKSRLRFFLFLPQSGLLPFIPAAIWYMSDIAFTFCARCGRRQTALLRTWPFGGQKNIIPSLHPSAFSFRRRRRGHSIPRSVHCRRHHATRWRPPRPRKKRSLLPRFCLHCGWKSPLLETRLSLFFRPSGAFCMKSGKVGESGATLTLIR